MSTAQHLPGSRDMRQHSYSVEWRYVIPPVNNQRLVIMQRQDGPFRKDVVGDKGHYYTSREELVDGRWSHVAGSATGGHASFEIAYEIAERAWQTALTKAAGSASS